MSKNNALLIKSYFPSISEEQEIQFENLENQYKHWNSRINVISRKEDNELYIRHVLHSLGIAKVKKFENKSTVLDVGTGGGFPGIPLAILFPKSEFMLIDSIEKKIMVVNNIIQALGLRNVKTQTIRAEKISNKFDYVVSRAVTQAKPLYSWVKDKVKPKGSIFFLKGGDLKEEMATLKKPYSETSLKNYFKEDFFETKKIIEIPC